MPNLFWSTGNRSTTSSAPVFALVYVRTAQPVLQDEMARRGTVVVTAHPGTDLDRWLRAGRATAAALRPDRMVPCAGRNLAERLQRGTGFHLPIPALRRSPAHVPADELEPYATQAIVDPHPHYARLRATLVRAVWLPKQRVYALPRYAQCKAVLRDDTYVHLRRRGRAGPSLQTGCLAAQHSTVTATYTTKHM